MSTYIFNFSDLKDQSMEVELPGKILNIRFLWNSTFNFWSYFINDSENQSIMQGYRLVTYVDLFGRWRHLIDVPGKLVCMFTDESMIELNENSLINEEAYLMYYE